MDARIITFLALCCAGLGNTEIMMGKNEPDDWIDPTDMLNFDHASMKMHKHNRQKTSEAQNGNHQSHDEKKNTPQVPSTPQPTAAPKEDKAPVKENDKDQSTSTVSPVQTTFSAPMQVSLYRQHVKMLLDKWDYQAPAGDSAHVNMVVSLSRYDVEMLRKFASTGVGNIHDVHQVLQRMVVRTELAEGSYSEAVRLEYYIGISLQTLIQILAVIALISIIMWVELTLQVSWRQKLVKLTMLAFFISIPWQWFQMYKIEEAKRQSVLMKEAPKECHRSEMSLFEMAMEVARSSFSLTENKCVVYYEQMLVDPLWKVPPTEAVAVTFVRFFVSPARHIGAALSEFVKGTLQHLPVTLWPVMIIGGLVITVLVLFMFFGYSIRLPFVSIERGRREHPLEQQLQLMLTENREQMNKMQAIQATVEQIVKEQSRQNYPSGNGENIGPPRSILPKARAITCAADQSDMWASIEESPLPVKVQPRTIKSDHSVGHAMVKASIAKPSASESAVDDPPNNQRAAAVPLSNGSEEADKFNSILSSAVQDISNEMPLPESGEINEQTEMGAGHVPVDTLGSKDKVQDL